MSVYTQLSLSDIQLFATNYGLNVVDYQAIQSGIENSNYFVQTEAGKDYVLTLFEELNAQEAAFLAPLLQHLQQAGVLVAAPLVANNGQSLLTLKDKPAQLAPRIVGQHPLQVTPVQAQAMGEQLAKLHLTLKKYPLKRTNAHGATWWQKEAAKARNGMSNIEQLILDTVLNDFEETIEDFDDLPQGLIHGDLFRDNTLFEGDKLSAILDFSEASKDYWLLDIAITANDFCSDWPNVGLNKPLFDAFLLGYGQVRTLTDDEQEVLPTFLAMAATRFWLSRLSVAKRNIAEGRVGENVLQKDPQQMFEMVKARLM
ncbi:MAG: homoserine kinase [Moraxellaceae bacterium]|nr:homoserine kinase [Moraxellaceae bacterium]